METIAKIRRDHRVHGKSIKAIARDRGVSRNTVRKVLRNDVTSPSYQRTVQPQRKLGKYQARLDELLEQARHAPRRERWTFLRMYELLRDEGYAGGYDAVRRYGRRWQRENGARADAFVPLTFQPGEAFQFDWSDEIVVIAGTTRRVKAAHVRLCHSRMRLVCVYPRETQEMLFDAHAQAFEFFGGTCTRGIYDNMKTAVETVFTGKERKFNRRFEQMCSHYLIEPVACSPGAGWEKGQVENQVNNSRERLFTPRLHFESFEALNAHLRDRCLAEARRLRHPECPADTVYTAFERERQALIPFVNAFDGYRSETRSASRTCLVSFDRNRYSVPASASGRPVEICGYARRVVIRLDGVVIAEHERRFGRDEVVYDPWHYLPILLRKPGALRNGAPFQNWPLPAPLQQVRDHLAEANDGDRQMVEVLAATLTTSVDVVCQACQRALDSGAITSTVILNLVDRQTQPEPAATIQTPEGLSVAIQPEANCARYDSLRSVTDAAA